MENAFTYMGKAVKIELNKSADKATVTIDGKPFKAMLHIEGKPEDNYIKLWMCEGAYPMFETPQAMAHHLIRYWHRHNGEGA